MQSGVKTFDDDGFGDYSSIYGDNKVRKHSARPFLLDAMLLRAQAADAFDRWTSWNDHSAEAPIFLLLSVAVCSR